MCFLVIFLFVIHSINHRNLAQNVRCIVMDISSFEASLVGGGGGGIYSLGGSNIYSVGGELRVGFENLFWSQGQHDIY